MFLPQLVEFGLQRAGDREAKCAVGDLYRGGTGLDDDQLACELRIKLNGELFGVVAQPKTLRNAGQHLQVRGDVGFTKGGVVRVDGGVLGQIAVERRGAKLGAYRAGQPTGLAAADDVVEAVVPQPYDPHWQ